MIKHVYEHSQFTEKFSRNKYLNISPQILLPMGVPGLYRTIFQKYTGTYKWVVPGEEHIDYFYLDFNPIIYVCYFNLVESGKIGHKLAPQQVEKLLIIEVIKVTSYIINVLVQPTKLAYIALDGPAPKCKLILQRSRRYKNLLEEQIKQRIQNKYKDPKVEPNWSRSNITPGTRFMFALGKALNSAIAQGIFSRHPHEDNYTVIFNDSNVPGEGEHKITKSLNDLECSSDETCCVYSNDGDLIILGCRFPRKKLLILTNPSFLPKNVVNDHDLSSEYIYFDHTEFREQLFIQMGEYSDPELVAIRSPERLLLDFMGISFLAGNDFVQPIPFLKMRYSHTYPTLLEIYTRVVIDSMPTDRYLVSANGLDFDHDILMGIFLELAKQENFRMKDYQSNVLRHINMDSMEWGPFDRWEDEWSDYQHSYYYSPRHPEHVLCRDDFKYFKYDDPSNKHEWKGQYYNHHFGLDKSNISEYNKNRTRICIAYLKSLVFTLRYYMRSAPPNWRWNYPHLVAPWPSDLLVVLKKIKMNSISQFPRSTRADIYSPFEQLLLTIPKSSNDCFPHEYTSLKQFLPNVKGIELDMVSGEKYIYADPKIPRYNEVRLLKEAKKIKLTGDAAERNKLSNRIWIRKF